MSPERLSEVIGAIYDCAIAPEKWPVILELLRVELGFAFAALGVLPLRAGAQIINVAVGGDEAWLNAMPHYEAEIAAGWGGPQRLAQFALDEPVIASQIQGVRFDENRYYREVMEPRGIFDAVGIAIAREPSLVGFVVFSRHRSAGPIGVNEMNILRLLGPHFRRAVTISNLFDLKAIEAATFLSVLDGVAFGVVLVGPELGIVHCNAPAAALLEARDPIQSQRGILALRERLGNEALGRAVRLASDNPGAMGARGIGIPTRGERGDPCVIHVLPLRRGVFARALSPAATAALFIAPAAMPAPTPTDALAALYDLTPAEKRICEMVAGGAIQSDIANTLGIARATVKTHVLRILSKTNCKRQVDLAGS